MLKPTLENPIIDPNVTTVDLLRAKADGLFRIATECIRQQDRCAHLGALSCAQTEKRVTQSAARHAIDALASMLESYEKSSANVKVDGADEAWWRKANAVWMAAREFARRHSGTDAAAKDLSAPDAGRFGELALDFELEASALLALRQAADAYRQVRPDAV
ncbi:MAG: hypothetical protein IT355_04470 [Gemmatimonadaceae bacterium]|nr:hypothetical protein [Gemmatimonadaceae bacterium]